MSKYVLIWYDLNSEKERDEIEASTREEAIRKGFMKYNGNPPASLVEAVLKENT